MTLKEFLILKKIKQVEVAKAIGTTAPTISCYLNNWGKLPEKFHESLAKFLGLTLEEIKLNKIKRGRNEK